MSCVIFLCCFFSKALAKVPSGNAKTFGKNLLQKICHRLARKSFIYHCPRDVMIGNSNLMAVVIVLLILVSKFLKIYCQTFSRVYASLPSSILSCQFILHFYFSAFPICLLCIVLRRTPLVLLTTVWKTFISLLILSRITHWHIYAAQSRLTI